MSGTEKMWCSQQNEACAVSEPSRQSEGDDWADRLRNAAASVGGMELEEPTRHPARSIELEE